MLLPNGKKAEWQTVDALVRSRALTHPEQLALEVSGRNLNYRELDSLSDTVASNLAALGVSKGERVATVLFNSVEQILLFLGTVKLGAIWVPLNVSLQSRDLRHVLRDCDPKVVIFDQETKSKIDFLSDDAATGYHSLIVGEANPDSCFDRLLNANAEAPVPVQNCAGDAAIIIYTGGTTGLPKGVVLPHFALIAAGYRYIECFSTTPRDIHYSVLSMFHVGGLLLAFMGPLVAAIPTHFERWFSASRFWKRTKETGATITDPIGTMVTVLCKAPETDADTDNPIRIAIGVLGQVPKSVGETFCRRFDLEIANAYSLTESGGTVIVHNPPDSPKPASNGKAWGWADITIRDTEDAPLPPDQIGEICLRPSLPHIFMQSYFNNSEATLRIWQNLWLHTGDLGYLDEEGYLFFTGRRAHWLRVKGENVSAHEVEGVLSEYQGVEESIVVGVPAELGDDDVKAFLRVSDRDSFNPQNLVEWCRSRLASFKTPRYIEIVDEFPRSATKREVERHKLIMRDHCNAWDATKLSS